jgi:uncharacterized protein GlcG (DUF336 family)
VGNIEILSSSDAWRLAETIRNLLSREAKIANFAIVNLFCQPLVLVYQDGTRPITSSFALKKATIAAKTGQSTRWLTEKAGTGEYPLELFDLSALSHVPWAGGCPIYSAGGIQLGGLGVSGLEENDDERICIAAILASGCIAERS